MAFPADSQSCGVQLLRCAANDGGGDGGPDGAPGLRFIEGLKFVVVTSARVPVGCVQMHFSDEPGDELVFFGTAHQREQPRNERARLKGCKGIHRKRGQKQVERGSRFSRLNNCKVRCSTSFVLFLVGAFFFCSTDPFSAVPPQDIEAPKSLANPGNFVQYGRPEPSSFEGRLK